MPWPASAAGAVGAGQQLVVDLTDGGQLLARLGQGLFELEDTLLRAREVCAQRLDGIVKQLLAGQGVGDLAAERFGEPLLQGADLAGGAAGCARGRSRRRRAAMRR